MALLLLKRRWRKRWRCDRRWRIPHSNGWRQGLRAHARRILFWVLGEEWRPQAVRAPASAWKEVLSVPPGTEASICEKWPQCVCLQWPFCCLLTNNQQQKKQGWWVSGEVIEKDGVTSEDSVPISGRAELRARAHRGARGWRLVHQGEALQGILSKEGERNTRRYSFCPSWNGFINISIHGRCHLCTFLLKLFVIPKKSSLS